MNFINQVPVELIREISSRNGVAWDLVAAVVMTESSGITTAHRYEKDYRWLYFEREIAEHCGVPYEFMCHMQKTSWGLMQVMGAVAYERGLSTSLLPSVLACPETGLLYGCLHLKAKMHAHGDEAKAVSAYNQGSPAMINGMFKNQRYVDKVFGYLRELRKLN